MTFIKLQPWTKYCSQIQESNIDFPMEYFEADFWQFCCTAVKVYFSGGPLSTFPLIPSISETSLKLISSLRF